MDPSRKVVQLSKEERVKFIDACLNYPLNVTRVFGYNKAEVTAGGVRIDELHPKTLESTKQQGLYFAGEICDCDGQIGGFNFQWAWSSGYAVANGIKKYLKK